MNDEPTVDISGSDPLAVAGIRRARISQKAEDGRTIREIDVDSPEGRAILAMARREFRRRTIAATSRQTPAQSADRIAAAEEKRARRLLRDQALGLAEGASIRAIGPGGLLLAIVERGPAWAAGASARGLTEKSARKRLRDGLAEVQRRYEAEEVEHVDPLAVEALEARLAQGSAPG